MGEPLATESPSLTNKRGTIPKKLSGFKANVFEGLALVKNFSASPLKLIFAPLLMLMPLDINEVSKILYKFTTKASPLKVNN